MRDRRRFLLNKNWTNSDIDIIRIHTSNDFGARSRDLTNSDTIECLDFTVECVNFTVECLDFTVEARSERNRCPV